MAMGEAGTSRNGLTFNGNAKRLRGKISGYEELGINGIRDAFEKSVEEQKQDAAQYITTAANKENNA
jgi:hypothetical protein